MALSENWQKSAFCANNACVEVRRDGDTVQIRDSKQGETGGTLDFTREEWNAFLDGAGTGQFDI